MYGGQGNFIPQFRQSSIPPPPPSYQQSYPGPAPPSLMQAPPGPSFPPYIGRMMASQAQPVHFTHPPPAHSTQPYLQLPPPPPTAPPPPQPPPPPQASGSASAVPPYPLPLPPPPPRPNSQPHSFRPPHHAIVHAPPRPPWPTNAQKPTFPNPYSTVPASFVAKNHVIDAPPPPPPPPPPPSSPPPLPPSPPAPALEVFPSDSMKVFTTDLKADSNASIHLVDNAPAHLVDGEASESLALAPPRPDEAVARSIEVLCQFIAKVGPDFENTARAKEAGNPQFAFLFGGEPGSAAAIGHEYFQWMKKKYADIMESPNGLKQKILSIGSLTADVSSQSGMDKAHSPAASDMDMEGEQHSVISCFATCCESPNSPSKMQLCPLH